MVNKAYETVEVITNEKIASNIYKMVVKGNFVAKAGQFYMVKCFEDKTMLPRPISICDVTDTTLTLLYAVVGKGTKIMAEKTVGETVEVLGPLGNGFNIDSSKVGKKVALVAGGIGIAPMLYLAKEIDAEIDLYLGFRDETYFVDEFKPYVDNIYITTNDGSVGHKGFVTEIIKKNYYDKIYCCGPNPMMKSVKNLGLNIPIDLSLESRMACGIGACLACSCRVKDQMRRICKDGPIFEASEVVF
ncbi:dihydroorotate dehydrogenase electron transfer subunit [Actinomyces sp. zg-332]|uniref:dihydroorotate dehydrogenase electron transfer subunit n=1 Tax=Actinomyces sp. zg-332 TaxID=2708340 RepID=UPI001421916C|nr:dihydroorotate dehydrogenase electron transfer subunit [Actinomyces sp. zg-332]QPK93702.1 dihydroorotate dehydrogenase electron transfer subunit [Actinomyces sp. zg-332]